MPELSTEFWIATGIAVALAFPGIAVGIGMDAKTKGEFRFVVGCFVASALVMLYGVMEFDVNTGVNSFFVRMALVCAMTSVVVFSLGESIRWAQARHNRSGVHGSERSKEDDNSPPDIRLWVDQDDRRPYFVSPRGGSAILNDYIVLPDVKITNAEKERNVSVVLQVNIGSSGIWKPVNLPIKQWEALQRPNFVSGQPQLTFPVNLPPGNSKGGYVSLRKDNMTGSIGNMMLTPQSTPGLAIINTSDSDYCTFVLTDLISGTHKSYPIDLTNLTKITQPPDDQTSGRQSFKDKPLELLERWLSGEASVLEAPDPTKEFNFLVSLNDGSKIIISKAKSNWDKVEFTLHAPFPENAIGKLNSMSPGDANKFIDGLQAELIRDSVEFYGIGVTPESGSPFIAGITLLALVPIDAVTEKTVDDSILKLERGFALVKSYTVTNLGLPPLRQTPQ